MKNSTRRQIHVIGVACCIAAIAVEAVPAGKFYTAVNIWYEHPQKIYSTNYHAGQMIPGGTEIEIISSKGSRVKFRVAGEETEFMYTYVKKHSSISFESEFERIFTEENQFADVVSEAKGDMKKAIEDGEIIVGMTREQVIAAYGYPPSHATVRPETADNWKYWVKRMSNKYVEFEDGKVVAMK